MILYHFIPLFLLLFLSVNSVQCSSKRIIGYKSSKIYSVNCWDDFDSPLSITGLLPDGLTFENNTIDGTPYIGKALHPYYVTSQRDLQHPFTIYIGVYSSPYSIFVEEKDTFILKNVFIDCIPIHGNTIFDSFVISPELPQGIVIDEKRKCIGGVYSGYVYGKQDYTLEGRNSYGSTRTTFSLYFTATSQVGLVSEFYSIAEEYQERFRYLPLIPDEAVTLEKKSTIPQLNYTSHDLSSPQYSYGVSTIPVLYAVFHGFLYFLSSGVYHFRNVFESERDRKCNQFRVFLDNELIVDSWSIPASFDNPFEFLQTMYIDEISTRSFKVEWYASCPKIRPIRLEWKKPSSRAFEPISSSDLLHSMENVFVYEETTTTCRMNKYYRNAVIVDERIIEGLTHSSEVDISFEPEMDLPQGLTVDPRDGTISGYPTLEVTEKKVVIRMKLVTSDSVHIFQNGITISVIGMNPTPGSIIYFRNNTQVSTLNITTLEAVELIPKSESHYLFYSITPSLPSFLSLDPYSGRIEGSSLQCLEQTHFTIQGESVTSVVKTVLTLTISKGENATVVGGMVDGVHSHIQVYENETLILDREITEKEVIGCYTHDSYQLTVTNFRNWSWITEDGLQLVLDNNLFVQHNVTSVENLSQVVLHVNMTALERPDLSLLVSNYTFYTGYSIPDILLTVTQPHYSITVTPSLPSTVSILPRKDGVPGYRITGYFASEGEFEYVITARNNRGSDSVHLKVVVETAVSNQNEIVVVDTSTADANYTISFNGTLIFDRLRYSSNLNTVTIGSIFQGDFTVTLCGMNPSETYHVFLFLNNRELLFSESSPSPPSPVCVTHLFNIHEYANVDSLWKYHVSVGSLPSEWRYPYYNDEAWPSNRNQFLIYPDNNFLYLRKVFTFNWFDSSLLMNLFILHREGIIFYINGEEVFRANMGYSSSLNTEYPATKIFPFPRYTRFSVSSNLLQNGTNVFAARIQLHKYSSTNVNFNVIAHLIGNTILRQVASFPIVRATGDYFHANAIVNNYRDFRYYWSGRNHGSIITMDPLLARSYVDTVEITRSVDCLPRSVEIWGLFGDYEDDGNFVFRETLLLKENVLTWGQQSSIPLRISSRLAGYRGYQVRFGTGVASADCIHVKRLDFYASKQVNCVSDNTIVSIGDTLRTHCPGGDIGVLTRECLQTGSGGSWSAPSLYCYSPAVQRNHKKVWFTLVMSSVSYQKRDMEDVLKDTLCRVLRVKKEVISIYYSYMKQSTEFFYYWEWYVLIDQFSLMRPSLVKVFKQKEEELVRLLMNEVNKETAIKIVDVTAVEDRLFLVYMYYCVPILLILTCFSCFYYLLVRRKKEHQDNVYLLSYTIFSTNK